MMKRCPTCSRVYDDLSLQFCQDDGTELVNKPLESPAPETLVMPGGPEDQSTISAFQPPPPPFPPPARVSAFKNTRQKNLIIWILIIGLGLPFVGGAIGGVWVVFHRRALTWHLVLEVDPSAPDRSAAVTQTVAVLDRRLDAAGLSNYEVRPEGDPATGRIVINLPQTDDPDRVKKLITTWGKLELVHVVSPPSPAPAQTYATMEEAIASYPSRPGEMHRVLPYTEREEINSSAAQRWVVVKSPPIVTGSDLRTASAVNLRGDDDTYQIQFSLKPAGAEKFGAWTGANINQYLGVSLNDELKSIAYIKSQINDQGEISGRFTKQSAEDLALVLKAGALPVPVKLVDEKVDQ